MARQYFPIFWDTSSGTALVVGGGEDACRKIRLLLNSGARVKVVALDFNDEIKSLASERRVEAVERPVSEQDIKSAALVIAATGIESVDEFCSNAAQVHGVKINVVDRPDLSDFTVPSIVDRSPVLVAVSTAGTAPVLGRKIRTQLEAALAPNLGKLANFSEGLRKQVKERVGNIANRRTFWEKFFESKVAEQVLSNDITGAEQTASQLIDDAAAGNARKGRVVMVGAGPGAADLLTLKALRALQEADVIIYDALVGPDVLNLARRDAFRLYVGKQKGRHSYSQERINGILVDEAHRGSVVVRLKGGDPFVFGRGGEEIRALKDAGIPVDVVPGITAATGAAAALGLPLTHRDHANVVSFATGHPAKDKADPDFQALSDPNQTAVIYMGKTKAAEISQSLINHGRQPSTPVAVIENATLESQRVIIATLDTLPLLSRVEGLTGPTLIVVGDVVSEVDANDFEHIESVAAPWPLRTVA